MIYSRILPPKGRKNYNIFPDTHSITEQNTPTHKQTLNQSCNLKFLWISDILKRVNYFRFLALTVRTWQFFNDFNEVKNTTIKIPIEMKP